MRKLKNVMVRVRKFKTPNVDDIRISSINLKNGSAVAELQGLKFNINIRSIERHVKPYLQKGHKKLWVRFID